MASTIQLKPPTDLKIDFSPSPKQYEVWKALQPECPYCGGEIVQRQTGLDRNGNPTYGPICSKCGETNIPELILEGGAAGGGKALIISSLVCTPFGFRPLKDLKIGDIISDPLTGGQQKIIYIHPKGEFDFYRIHFIDGTHTDCSEGHLWRAHKSHHKSKKAKLNPEYYKVWGDDRLWTAKQMFDFYEVKKSGVHADINLIIPLTEPVQFTSGGSRGPLTIHPYILGAIIGDGCVTNKILERNYVQFSTIDDEIRDRFIAEGYDMSHWRVDSEGGCRRYNIYDQKLLNDLKELGVAGQKSQTHFIPERYLYSTIEDRIQLMQGLIDTDGYVDNRGHVTYISTSKQLAEDVAFVVRSLGGVATITQGKAGYKKNGEYIQCSDAYDVQIRTKMNPDLCGLKRKKERARYEFNGGASELGKRIVDVEYIGKQESFCISVSSPSGLYVADNFTVTHNSYLGACWLISSCMRWPNMRMVVARLTLRSLRESTWNTILSVAKAWGLEEGVNYKVNNFLGEMTFWNDSKIMMKELIDLPSDPDFQRLGSSEYSGAFVDEVGQISSKAIDVLRSRIRWNIENTTKVPKLLMSTNPCLGWIRDRFVQDEEGNPVVCADGERYIPFSVFDNPDESFRKVYVANLDRIADKATRERLKYGNWDFVDANVAAAYWNFDGEKHLFSGLREKVYNPMKPLILAFDFNVNPYMSVLVSQIDYENKRLYILEEIIGTPEEKTNNTPALSQKVREKYINEKHLGGLFITGDPAGLTRSTATESGVNNYTIIAKTLTSPTLHPQQKLLKKQPPQTTRLEFVNALFKNYDGWQIMVDLRCRRFTEDMIYQKKNPDGTKFKAKGIDVKTGLKFEKYGHMSDCFDYTVCLFLQSSWVRFVSDYAATVVTMDNGTPIYGSFDF